MAHFLKTFGILFALCVAINAKPWEEIGNGDVDINDGSQEYIVAGDAVIQNGKFDIYITMGVYLRIDQNFMQTCNLLKKIESNI